MIQLQFVTSTGFVSKMIRLLTWSEFSHVDIVLPDGRLLGARSDGGVSIRNPNYYGFSKVLIVRLDCPAEAVIALAVGQLGKPYDYAGVINFALQRNWRTPDSWFCSELVAWAFEMAGYPLLNPSADIYRITPRDLLLSPLIQY